MGDRTAGSGIQQIGLFTPGMQGGMQEDEARMRDEQRSREDEVLRKKAEAERLEDEKRQREDRAKRDEELRRQRAEAHKWEELGSTVIQPLPKAPPPVADARYISHGKALSAWALDSKTSQATYTTNSLKPGKLRLGTEIATVDLKDLTALGVCYWKVSLNDFSTVNSLCKERAYKHVEEVRLHQTTKDEATLERWFTEHCLDDEQLRLVLDGSMYIDIRSNDDTWTRLHLTPGDLVVIPPGLYHRSALDENDYVWIMRFLRDSSRWHPLYRHERNTENHPARVKYLAALRRGVVAAEAGF
ncbi:hypothetical protein DIPPA_02847 [Diplonema papillatum]|nr:hypothetical protein DIPPA_02847 [Diplonema papillatum]